MGRRAGIAGVYSGQRGQLSALSVVLPSNAIVRRVKWEDGNGERKESDVYATVLAAN
jgi:hypothetical protein